MSILNKTKSILCFSLLVLLLGLPISSVEAAQISEQDLAALERNCETQEQALQTSMQELDEALKLLTESEQELTELQNALSESEADCEKLTQELLKQKAEIAKLRGELLLLKNQSAKVSEALTKAEQSLNDAETKAKSELKKQSRQKRLWQIVAVVLGGVAIGK